MANSPANKPGSRYGFVIPWLLVAREYRAKSTGLHPESLAGDSQGNSAAQKSRGSAASEFPALHFLCCLLRRQRPGWSSCPLPRNRRGAEHTGYVFFGVNLNLCPATDAWNIAPPFTIVNTTKPL
jgi:hypothetical protein